LTRLIHPQQGQDDNRGGKKGGENNGGSKNRGRQVIAVIEGKIKKETWGGGANDFLHNIRRNVAKRDKRGGEEKGGGSRKNHTSPQRGKVWL